MSKLMELLGSLYRDELPPELPCEMTHQKDELLRAILDKLISYGLLNDAQQALDWKEDLADLSEVELITGWRKAKDHRGYLEFGQFREMCKIPVMRESFRNNLPPPVEGAIGKEEHNKRTAKMKQEMGL